MKQNKLTTLEKNFINMVIKSNYYNFLNLKECEIILNFLINFLNNKSINYYQKKQTLNLIEKLSTRNTLNKDDKRLISLLLFIDKSKSKKRYENNINYVVSSFKNAIVREKNNTKLYLFKISLFFAFMLQFLVIKGASI